MLGNQMHLGFDHFKIDGPVSPCSQSPFNSWRDELQNDEEIKINLFLQGNRELIK